MAYDAHTNFGYSTVAIAPAPAASGTSLTVVDASSFPVAPFNMTVWPTGTFPLGTNAEIIRVTAIVGNVLTILRAQEGSSVRTILVGDQIAATITAKTLTDVETATAPGGAIGSIQFNDSGSFNGITGSSVNGSAIGLSDGGVGIPSYAFGADTVIGIFRDTVLAASALGISTAFPGPPSTPAVNWTDPSAVTNGTHEVYLTFRNDLDGTETLPSAAGTAVIDDNQTIVLDSLPDLPYGATYVAVYITKADVTGSSNAHFIGTFNASSGVPPLTILATDDDTLTGDPPSASATLIASVLAISGSALLAQDYTENFGAPFSLISTGITANGYPQIVLGDAGFNSLVLDLQDGAAIYPGVNPLELGIISRPFTIGRFSQSVVSPEVKSPLSTGGTGVDLAITASDGFDDGMSTPNVGGDVAITPGLGVNGGADGKIFLALGVNLASYNQPLGHAAALVVSDSGDILTAENNSIPIVFGGSVTATDFIVNGSAFKTDTTDGHQGFFQAYDVDGTAYKTFATLTNGNTPSFALSAPSGGTLSGDFSTLKIGGTNVLTTSGSGTSLTFPGALSIAALKTFTASNTLTLTAVDGSTLAIGAGGTLGTAAYTATSAYEVPLTFSTGLTRTVNTVTVNASQSISTLSNLTSNGLVTTSGGTGALSVSAMGTGVLTFLATPSSANLAAALTDETGSGLAVFATSPTLTTPVLGVATATSINGNTFTTGTYTLTGAASKTLTFNNSLTLAGTDSTTMTFPTTSATIARTDAAQTFTGSQTIAALVGPVTITEAVGSSALTITGNTQVSSFPALNITQTFNNSGTTFAGGIFQNITNTASNAASKIIDLQVGTASKFSVNVSGSLVAANDITSTTNGIFSSGSAGFVATNNGASYGLRNNGTRIFSDASNQIDIRNAGNAQTFRIYNTYTSASVFEALTLNFASSVAHIGTITTGATARVLQLDYGGTTTAAISIPITSGAITFGGGITLSAADIATDTTTGTKIGTATTQKIGFFNATPIVQVVATTDLGLALSNLGLRAAGTTVLDSPKITTGVAPDGSGFKHKRVSTGSISAGSTALVDITWGTAFADTNYTAEASVVDSTNTSLSLSIVHIETIAADKIQVRVLNNALGSLTGTIHAVAVHD